VPTIQVGTIFFVRERIEKGGDHVIPSLLLALDEFNDQLYRLLSIDILCDRNRGICVYKCQKRGFFFI